MVEVNRRSQRLILSVHPGQSKHLADGIDGWTIKAQGQHIIRQTVGVGRVILDAIA